MPLVPASPQPIPTLTSNEGYYSGVRGIYPTLNNQTKANDKQVQVSDSTQPLGSRYLIPSSTDPVSPIASDMFNAAGVYVGKRALDKWKYSLNAVKQVVVFGDSTAQGSVGGFDGWPERLSRNLDGKIAGGRITAGAGFYGLFRSGTTLAATNTDKDWYAYGFNSNATPSSCIWQAVGFTVAGLAPLTGTYIGLNANVVAVNTSSNGTTTSGSLTFGGTFGTSLADPLHKGALITGPGIPPNTYITSILSATSATMSQPASATGASLALTVHGGTMTWNRPLSSNNRSQLIWSTTTATSTNLNGQFANFDSHNYSNVLSMVTGTNIPANTIISAFVDYNNVTLSNATTGSVTGTGHAIVHDGRTVSDAVSATSTTVTSATANFTYLDVNQKVVGTDIPAGTYILSVESPTSCTLSAATTGSHSSNFLFIQTNGAARHVDDMVTSVGTSTVTSATASFTQDDVGKQVVGTWIPNNTVIAVVNSATSISLTNNIQVTSTAGYLSIGANTSINVNQVNLLTVNGTAFTGATYTYSLDGGNSWIGVAQTNSGGACILNTQVLTTNPNTVIIRANTTAGAKSQMYILGLFAYQVANAPSGVCLYNIARDGWTLAQTGQNYSGDELALFDNALANGYHGLYPDLFIVMYTNDAFSTLSSIQKWWNQINRLISRVGSYADLIFVSAFEQGLPRDANTQRQFAAVLKQAALSTSQTYWYAADGVGNGTTTFTSATINFQKGDIGKTITGLGIPAGTTISSLTNSTTAVLSANVTTNTAIPFQILGNTPDTAAVVLDLYEAYAAEGNGPGFNAANKDGLMVDSLHETQDGHNEIARRISSILEKY